MLRCFVAHMEQTKGVYNTNTVLNSNPYLYKEKNTQTILKRLLKMSTEPVYTQSMGGPQFLYNITGLSFKDLFDLDMETIDLLEEEMMELSKQSYTPRIPNDDLNIGD